MANASMCRRRSALAGGRHRRKLTLYFDEGADEVWILHPGRKTMTVYVMRNGDVIRFLSKPRTVPTQGVTVPLSSLFE
jgi:hypothetical protein